MLLTLGLKFLSYHQFKKALADNQIRYESVSTRPTPLNSILWAANVQVKDGFLIGYYSFFDKKDIQFSNVIPKNHYLLKPILNEKKLKQLIKITEGWYAIALVGERLIFNDLRYGQNNISDVKSNFVFSYELFYDENGMFQATELPKDFNDGMQIVSDLLTRIKGV
jgi:inner membrane protein